MSTIMIDRDVSPDLEEAQEKARGLLVHLVQVERMLDRGARNVEPDIRAMRQTVSELESLIAGALSDHQDYVRAREAEKNA